MTETVSNEAPSRSGLGAGVRVAAAVVGVTAGLYAAWLGWDQERSLDPTTSPSRAPTGLGRSRASFSASEPSR